MKSEFTNFKMHYGGYLVSFQAHLHGDKNRPYSLILYSNPHYPVIWVRGGVMAGLGFWQDVMFVPLWITGEE